MLHWSKVDCKLKLWTIVAYDKKKRNSKLQTKKNAEASTLMEHNITCITNPEKLKRSINFILFSLNHLVAIHHWNWVSVAEMIL